MIYDYLKNEIVELNKFARILKMAWIFSISSIIFVMYSIIVRVSAKQNVGTIVNEPYYMVSQRYINIYIYIYL